MSPPPNDLLLRLRLATVRPGPFHLPNGEVLNEYFDEYALAADPKLLRLVAEEMAGFVPRTAEVLVGLELSGVALAVALSAATGVPATFMRRNRKAYGTRQLFEGAPLSGRRTVLVDDVTRSGSQLCRAAVALRECDAEVSCAIVVLDRGLGAFDQLARIGIRLRYLVPPGW